MAAYDDNCNLLATTYPELKGEEYVGSECTKQGSYSFVYKLKFNTPSGGDRTQFIPVVQMAFSTQGDSGYNLGAVNLECLPWDEDYPIYMSWRKPETKGEKIVVFIVNNGMFIFTAAMLSYFVYYMWNQSILLVENNINSDGLNDPDGTTNNDYVSSSKMELKHIDLSR
jgi:hypothetical protein